MLFWGSKKMKVTMDAFEQSIEDNAEKFVPLSDAEKNKIEAIIDTNISQGD